LLYYYIFWFTVLLMHFMCCAIIVDEALYIFAHNIDGPMLRSSSVQTFLASLSAVENVHLIASIDHVNAPLSESNSNHLNIFLPKSLLYIIKLVSCWL